MPIEITMPRLSDTMESGTVIKWIVAEGDAVSSGDVVADVETDKATMELTVYDDGTMAKILVDEGRAVDVGTPIAIMAEEGEDPTTIDGASDAAAAPPEDVPVEAESGAADAPEPGGPIASASAPPATGGRMRVTPVARHLAEEHKIDLGSLSGSGPSGRIIKRDVLQAIGAAEETAASVPPSATGSIARAEVPATRVPAAPEPSFGESGMIPAGRVPMTSMRQTIARRLVQSVSEIPHYQVSMTFDMDPLIELRRTLNEQLADQGVKLSVNDFIIRACALAMYQHHDFNASWDGDAIIVHERVNIGMAISVGADKGGGLVVGVIRDADRKSLRVIARDARQLAEKARGRGLSIEDMSDSTFTISNLGMFGVEHFTAIINPPNSAIMAVGGAVQKPVVRNGELVVGHEMTVTLSNDHRVIDGAMAAGYLQTVRQMIEHPATLLV